MLEGTKVLSFTHYMQGPSAAQVLADLGAEVVKVEAPKGAFERSWSGCNTYPGGVSMFFLLGNRNQTAISINLKSPEGKKIIYELVKEYDVVIENFRAGVMEKLGLGYLTLGEETPSLSGGEAQRLKLASEMGKGQSDSVFVFDEPTIGLHPLDVFTLLQVFQTLVDNGATVIVIEHDLDVIRNADYMIDMGPGGGEAGGRIVAAGTPEQVAKNPDSVTGRFL